MKSIEDVLSAIGAQPIPDEGGHSSGWTEGVMELVGKATEAAKLEVWNRFDWGAAGESLDKDDIGAAVSVEAYNAVEATEHNGREMFLLAVNVGIHLTQKRPATAELIRKWMSEEDPTHPSSNNDRYAEHAALRIAAGQKANDATFRRTVEDA